jgi:hypothetical protein
MECFQERKKFLYKFKEHLDFILLTANKSVSDKLIKDTPDLPWNIDTNGKKRPIPKDYIKDIRSRHTVKDQNEWEYIETLHNPGYTWDEFVSYDKWIADPRWPDRFGRWFFSNLSSNQVLMNVPYKQVGQSLRKYIAATKIKRTFKRCVTTPNYPLCKSRLQYEFEQMTECS